MFFTQLVPTIRAVPLLPPEEEDIYIYQPPRLALRTTDVVPISGIVKSTRYPQNKMHILKAWTPEKKEKEDGERVKRRIRSWEWDILVSAD